MARFKRLDVVESIGGRRGLVKSISKKKGVTVVGIGFSDALYDPWSLRKVTGEKAIRARKRLIKELGGL